MKFDSKFSSGTCFSFSSSLPLSLFYFFFFFYFSSKNFQCLVGFYGTGSSHWIQLEKRPSIETKWFHFLHTNKSGLFPLVTLWNIKVFLKWLCRFLGFEIVLFWFWCLWFLGPQGVFQYLVTWVIYDFHRLLSMLFAFLLHIVNTQIDLIKDRWM